MIKKVLCSMPLFLKCILGKVNTLKNKEKRTAISEIAHCQSQDFPSINTPGYKNNLRKYLYMCAFSAKETREYIRYLYTDEIKLICQGKYEQGLPTIICVVKNEADKLNTFFNHYNKIGKFNFIIIDNGSSDSSVQIAIDNCAVIYQCTEAFSTNRKLSWINKVYSKIPIETWTILLDADELLVFDGYERMTVNDVLKAFDKKGIGTSAAIMIDMFSTKQCPRDKYLENYIYFENRFHEEKSFFFNSVYGGIREREFKFGKERIFLIKKHPIVKKDTDTMLIHCHYIYPFEKNFNSTIYFGLLHYKLFDSEIEKYKKIAIDGSYGDGSIEYKTYVKAFADKTYEQIFAISQDSVLYQGSESLKKIDCLHDVGEIM